VLVYTERAEEKMHPWAWWSVGRGI